MPGEMTGLQRWFLIVRRAILFQGLDDSALSRLIDRSVEIRRENGEFFFLQGDPSDLSYVLVEGKIRLSQVSPEGQQVIQGYIAPSREFGIIAAVSAARYPVSAQAATHCTALGWKKEVFRDLIASNPQIAQNALEIMGRQIMEFQSRVQELSTQRVEQRIARTLLRLARQSGYKTEQGVLIDLPLTRQDLAELTGTTLFTVSRLLKSWETRGLIISRRGKVIITSPHGLVTLAEDLEFEND